MSTSQASSKLADVLAEEEEEILKDVCINNGLSYSKLDQDGQTCDKLEMFFSGYPRIVGLKHFPNLEVLCIIGQGIDKLTGLTAVPNLQELWVCECDVKKLEGLRSLSKLKKLYLYNNEIEVMENLEGLDMLEVLWLNDNEITDIQGISHLKRLRELNLAANLISKLGNSLNNLTHLEKLELSGNSLASFKDLTNLNKLLHLRVLGLKSPCYAANPVCLLCNYSTHMLYHLPTITQLDGHDVSSKLLRELAETTVIKKKMYYNMRMKTLRRNLSEVIEKLKVSRDELEKVPLDNIRTLTRACKEIELELEEPVEGEDKAENHESGTESDKDSREAQAAEGVKHSEGLRTKHTAIKERIKLWSKKCEEINHYYKEVVEQLKKATEITINRLMSELESGGNVRFEDGKPTDPWFTSCHDLILSRFCAVDYKDQGIMGIKINRITRVHNRFLRTRFDDALSSLMDDEDSVISSSRTNSYRKYLEYLFWVWDPELPGGQTEPQRILGDGFMDADTYKKLARDAAVPLTNSLSLADRRRIKYITKQTKYNQFCDRCPFRQGQLVISKVYIGRSIHTNDDKLIEKSAFPKVDTVYRPRKHSDMEAAVKNLLGTKEAAPASPRCECISRQCEWFVFNNHLVMPEYVVDFEYITRSKPRNPFTGHLEGILESKDTRALALIADLADSEDVLQMEPEIRPRPSMVALSEELLLKVGRVTSLNKLKCLNLHGNCLTKLKHLQGLPLLRRLIVSFNELTRLDDLSQLNLEYLDASFNKITTTEGMKNMTKLKYLDLSWNQLCSTREEISILRKHTPSLTTLDLRHNNWQKPEGLRLRAIGRIKSLTMLNGMPVTESEATAALRMAAGSRISQVSLLAHSRTDVARPRTLSLSAYAQILLQCSRNKPDRASEQDFQWYSKVTTLSLDGQHISKLSNMDRLDNLRWASFNDNDITKIEGLDSCSNLEELSLEDNCISRLEGLSKLTKLRRLNIGHNYISSLEGAGLERLAQLHHLSLESNKITSLAGLQGCQSLIELYIGNNSIDSIREVFHLKPLPNLLILDLYGNPVVENTDNYRLFIIYHVRALKALDGQSIESSEANHAKDAFGGRLTQDFIAERIGHSNFNEIRELDFPSCSVRTVDLGGGQQFLNLRSINLEHNNLTSFSGLIQLVNLRVLCLNHNHIECLVPRAKQPAIVKSKISSLPMSHSTVANLMHPESYSTVLENLEVLHLGYNGIKDLAALQLSRLTSLKALFLQGNEITRVEGLEGLQDLRELVLDRNKIKGVSEYSFMNQWNLQELHLEENRIRDLSNFSCLESLQRLFLGMNRIQEMAELEKLDGLNNLVELSVVSNAVSRRLMHRPMLVYRLPSLMMIDGIPVSEEERAKAELYFIEQQVLEQWTRPLHEGPHSGNRKPVPQITTTVETTLPGIGQYKAQIPVKVTNMQLVSPHMYENTWGGTIHYAENVLQQELQRAATRRRANNKEQNGQSATNLNVNNTQRVGGTFAYQHAPSHPNAVHSVNTYQSALNRSHHQFSQIPYVPHQPPTSGDSLGQSESAHRLPRGNSKR